MNNVAEILAVAISLLTAVGFGGILGAYFQARFQQRSQVGQHEHELKQKRYFCILILMLTKLKPEVGLPKTHAIRPDLKTIEDVDDELTTELQNGCVYASDTVLKTLEHFIREPTSSTFVTAAAAMRKDLWGKKTSFSANILDLPSMTSGSKRRPS